ncbi:DNA-binding protein [Coprococcus sp. AM27-12LB]|nr:DNA-binding protein [Coprococcus sp. AM27-12LB]
MLCLNKGRALNMKKTMNNKSTRNKQKESIKVVETVPTKKEMREEQEQKAPLMLTIDETASKSGLSTYTIRTWIKTGVLPYVLIGRKYLISWDNFCRFLNSNMGVA